MSKARPRAKERKEDINLPLLPGQRRDPRLKKPDVLGAFSKAGAGFKRLRALLADQKKAQANAKKRR